MFAGWDTGGYGNTVVIEHPLGRAVDVRAPVAHRGEHAAASVAAGSTVGRVGTTGVSTGPHLHFELRLRGAAIDPLTALGASAVAQP